MTMTNTMFTAAAGATSPATQKVVIVNGSTDVLSLLESALDAGHYDIVFVESSDHAYSHVKRVQPNLVILCMRLDERDGFHVLSMLKLDDETRHIPVLTYTSGVEGDEADEEPADESGDIEMLAAANPALPMN